MILPALMRRRAAGWTPASLGGSLYTWNKHTSLPTSGAVTTWADSGSGIATATAVNGILAGVESNGLRYAILDGVADHFTMAGNPAAGNQVDFLDVAVCGLIWLDNQLLDTQSSQYRTSAFGADSTLNVYSAAATEDLELVIRQNASSTTQKEIFLGGAPQTHLGGTSAAPAYGPRSAPQTVPGGQWVSYCLVITSSRYDLYIDSGTTAYASVVGAQNVALPIKYIGASYLSGTGAIDRHLKGRISEFFGMDAAAADSPTRTEIFTYLNGLKP